ncbi:MAG: hypothetical protein KDA87_04705 [Planctomycetales bacterium]|nr:hypothetical protein [Planctomycetales bacterium]
MPATPNIVRALFIVVCMLPTVSRGQMVTFHKRATQVGDVSKQLLTCDLALEMKLSQGGQVIDARQQDIQRRQERRLTIESIAQNTPTSAVISYVDSSIELKQAGQDPFLEKQPVTGKSYRIVRQGETLSIKDMQGQTPPAEELEIIKGNLDTFGLPNPIANFFDGKQLKVGDTVSLPTELARELLGFSDSVGDVTDLAMRLVRIRKVGDRDCAEFGTKLVAKSAQGGDVQIELTGSIVLEIETCRTVAVKLSGPVEVNEVHGPQGAEFSVNSSGKLAVSVRAAYGETAAMAARQTTTK